jgi:hypothetical protein
VLSPKSPVVLPNGLDASAFSKRFNDEVLPKLKKFGSDGSGGSHITILPLLATCGDLVEKTCPFADTASAAMQDKDGGAVAPETAAMRIGGLLRQTRTIKLTQPTGGVPAGKRDYLGVLVSVGVRLEGLRDRRVVLRWSIWDVGSEHRLFGDWLASNLAYGLKAESDDDTVSLDLWIPMPKAKGKHYVRLTLDDQRGVHLDQKKTRSFK